MKKIFVSFVILVIVNFHKNIHEYDLQKIEDRKKINLKDFNLEDTIKDIKSILEQKKINADIHGRIKTNCSILKKSIRKKIPANNIKDIIGIKIITKNIEDCYRALWAIHTNYKIVKMDFNDYISNPKKDGYKSIHTIVEIKKNLIAEVQIKDKDMEKLANFSHKKYKQIKNNYINYICK